MATWQSNWDNSSTEIPSTQMTLDPVRLAEKRTSILLAIQNSHEIQMENKKSWDVKCLFFDHNSWQQWGKDFQVSDFWLLTLKYILRFSLFLVVAVFLLLVLNGQDFCYYFMKLQNLKWHREHFSLYLNPQEAIHSSRYNIQKMLSVKQFSLFSIINYFSFLL